MKLRDLGALLALAALWGGSFLFMRVAAPALGPVVLADARVLLAGAALLVYAALLRRSLALRMQWRRYLLLGALNAAIPYALIGAAELRLTAGVAAILNATTPLFTAIVAAVWLGDRLTGRKALGLVMGLLGVAVLVGWSPLPLDGATALAAGASLLAALSYGLAGVYARRAFAGASPLATATGQQLGAAALLLPFALPLAVTSDAGLTLTAGVALATLALALLCTSVAYLVYFYLITSVGPTSTLSVTFLVPLFGLVWSALFLREPVNGATFVGLAIILASVVFVTGARLPLRRARGSQVEAPSRSVSPTE